MYHLSVNIYATAYARPYWTNIFFLRHPVTPFRFTLFSVRVLMKMRKKIPPERQAVTIKMDQNTWWNYSAQNQCKVGEERVYIQVEHVKCKQNNAMQFIK